MINVTPTAATKITELLTDENKPGAGLRVFVQGGGCSGFQYGLMIDEGEGDESTDSVIESHGVKLLVDPISARYLAGAEVDFVDNITGGGFTENIPRILPDGVSVEINRGTWPELPIFGMMQRLANVTQVPLVASSPRSFATRDLEGAGYIVRFRLRHGGPAQGTEDR